MMNATLERRQQAELQRAAATSRYWTHYIHFDVQICEFCVYEQTIQHPVQLLIPAFSALCRLRNYTMSSARIPLRKLEPDTLVPRVIVVFFLFKLVH